MWYSGLACCIVVVLGACLSLVPGLQQEDHPDQDLLVPAMEVSINSLNFLKIKKNLFQVLFCCWPSNVQKMIEKYFKRMPNVDVTQEEVNSDKQSKVNNHIESGEEGIP